GLVAIGFADPASKTAADAQPVADAFTTAIELFRLRQREELQRDLVGLLDGVSTELSSTLNLASGLGVFCRGADRLFGADRTSVWLHDRRARHIVLQASSDPDHAARGVRVDADDPLAPAAAAMRRSRAELVSLDGATAIIAIPLR